MNAYATTAAFNDLTARAKTYVTSAPLTSVEPEQLVFSSSTRNLQGQTIPESTAAFTKPSRCVPSSETVLCSVDGVVLDILEEHAVVKLSTGSTTVHFPLSLFNEDLLNVGVPIKYQIVERQNGVRYQRFDVREDEPDGSLMDELESIIRTIEKY